MYPMTVILDRTGKIISCEVGSIDYNQLKAQLSFMVGK